MKQFIFLLLLVPAISSAGDIYKCTDTAGNPVYSQRPCSPEAEKIELEVHQVNPNQDNDYEEERLASQQRSDIRAEVSKLKKQRNRQIKAIDKQIAYVNYEITLSSNNYAGATRDIGLNNQLAELKSSKIDVKLKYQEMINEAENPD